jgi:hypothetical protein
MPTRGLLARTIKIQVSVLVKYKAAIIIITFIISLNANCSRQDISEDVLILALIINPCLTPTELYSYNATYSKSPNIVCGKRLTGFCNYAKYWVRVGIMVFSATFNNISAISWR